MRKTFISYRRDGGEIMAQLIHDRLVARGLSVFYDIESLKSGAFDVKLYKEIENCENFLLILPPQGLDRCMYEEDWVRKEISHALALKKNIIPVMLRGFEFPNNLPDDIKAISLYNGVRVDNMDYFDAKIEKIVSMLTLGKAPSVVQATTTKVQDVGNSTLIAQVRSVSSTIENDPSPAGEYSAVISTRGLRSICFHVFFNKRYAKEKDSTLYLKIYDSSGHLVCDNVYTCHVLTTYESIAVSWKVGSDNGCLLSEGSYRAEFILDNTGVYVYQFTVTSAKTREGFNFSFGRKLAEIENAIGLPKKSLSIALWVAAVAAFVGLVVWGVPKIWPDWYEFLTTPATEWFK